MNLRTKFAVLAVLVYVGITVWGICNLLYTI